MEDKEGTREECASSSPHPPSFGAPSTELCWAWHTGVPPWLACSLLGEAEAPAGPGSCSATHLVVEHAEPLEAKCCLFNHLANGPFTLLCAQEATLKQCDEAEVQERKWARTVGRPSLSLSFLICQWA